MICTECGSLNHLLQKFCGECGARLVLTKSPLDRTVHAQNYTPPHLANTILQSRSALEGERKQVTVLFCDIANSTLLAERIGPDRMHMVLSTFFEVALSVVHRFEGTVNQFLGDGFMALFGAPISQEDHARRGVLSAIAIRNAMASDPRFQELGIVLETRIGLNTGLVVVGGIGDNLRLDYTAIGDTTNVAARIQSLAAPGTIIASDSVVRVIREHVECKPIGARTLKGKSQPVELHEIFAERHSLASTELQTDTALVGRDSELEAIAGTIDRLVAGAGDCLAVVGEAGLGKSSLLQDAVRLAGLCGVQVLRGTCVSYGRTLSYWPFREVLRAVFEINDSDSEGASWNKFENAIERLFVDSKGEFLPYVGTLLALTVPEPFAQKVAALDGLSMRHQIFRSTLLLLERLSHMRPTIVMLEDWHWADSSSSELLLHLLPLAERVPLLFIVAARPEPQGGAASLVAALSNDSRAVRPRRILTLAALQERQCAELAEHLLGGGMLPTHVREMLVRRSGGNPFYVGELVRNLLGSSGIERDADSGEWRTTDRYHSTPLPDSIEGMILARVDRLDDGAKQLLKAASVVGFRFLYRVLNAIAEQPDQLEMEIEQLKAAQLIAERPEAVEHELTFTHPLIQQATYGSLLVEQRRNLHVLVGRKIEILFKDRIDEFLSVLAYHYAEAEDWDKAQGYLLMAGNQAGRIAANAEALDHFERALRTSQSPARALDPIKRAELERQIGESLFRLGRHRAALEHLFAGLRILGVNYPRSQRGVAVAIAVKLSRHLFSSIKNRISGSAAPTTMQRSPALASITLALEAIGNIDFFRNPLRYLLDVLTALVFVEAVQPSRELVVFSSAFAQALDAVGLYRFSNAYHAKSRRLAEELEDDLSLGYCHLTTGMHEYATGHWAAASLSLSAALRYFQRAGHLHNQSLVLTAQIIVLRSSGDPRWLSIVDEATELANQTQDEQAIGWASGSMGARNLHRGDYPAAAANFETSCMILEAIHDFRSLTHMLSRWGLCEARIGRPESALHLLEKSAQVAKLHNVGVLFEGRALAPATEALLCIGEQTSDLKLRLEVLLRAKSACQRLQKIGHRISDESGPEASRLTGTYCWLVGDRRRAVQNWQNGIKLAEKLGAIHVLAKIHNEIGLRMSDASHARKAKVLFDATGAHAE